MHVNAEDQAQLRSLQNQRIKDVERLQRETTSSALSQRFAPGAQSTADQVSLEYKRADGSTRPRDLLILFPDEVQNKSLFEKYNDTLREHLLKPKRSLITKALGSEGSTLKSPEAYAQPFCSFLTENPTVFHAVDYFEKKLDSAGFKKLSERKSWTEELEVGGKYYVSRNSSSLIAFSVGKGYKSGNGVAMAAGHVDALTARLKPVSSKKTSAGYVQLGVAPYAGALNTTWWDRDLGIGGRVVVKDEETGKITTKLVKLGWPIARIPSLAPHFGVGMLGTNNAETEAVPIIGLDDSETSSDEGFKNYTLGAQGTFAATQPPKLVRAIAGELSITDYSSIINWELELYDTQPAQVGGLEKEFIFAGRVDDKICSWVAIEGLIASAPTSSEDDGIVKLVGVFDDEEIGSLLRQGARGNFLPGTVERIAEAFSKSGSSANILSQTYANSFLLSADVTHAVNPNFLSKYLEGHAPRLNVGLTVAADSNGHMTTDSVSTALFTRIAEKCGSKLQLFQIRNDSRSGGTVGPMLSSAMGVRAIDAGIAQLSMHSIRATVGNLDPGLGVKIFKGFFDHFESVDAEFV
ncbi:putative vacuolar aspartyl aminopeptidase Lap4 [Mollisia scopiformis]|uniref:Putative vacuolar aspartyl aminopeptidase Lap4 n=1 Tax=Mollisia scopiformis TaxID=149040 RepID=A0A194XCC7_MOLSC|nr:putative vacuolar aspartyl aminopeptidase Lap4 [Mollisia scopiformis]KUJ17828.1 putative vacuolar aspartyl aminopeptidase Lap4 [Mollisia scopiformis]